MIPSNEFTAFDFATSATGTIRFGASCAAPPAGPTHRPRLRSRSSERDTGDSFRRRCEARERLMAADPPHAIDERAGIAAVRGEDDAVSAELPGNRPDDGIYRPPGQVIAGVVGRKERLLPIVRLIAMTGEVEKE